MKYKGLKKVMSICLSICMVCMPLSVNAQEINKDAVGSIQENDVFIQNSIPTENVDTYASNIEKSNTYEEITQTSENIEEYTKNNMERPYEGEKFSLTELPNESSTFATRSSEENTDPNYAYLVENGNTVQGNLKQTSEMRWYGMDLYLTKLVKFL